MKHFEYVYVPSHHPRMQENIPVHGIFGSQAMKQRIWIREDFRIEKMIQTQGTRSRSSGKRTAQRIHRLGCAVSMSRRWASSSLMFSILANIIRSTSSESSATVG